jgi:hypothetical protein
VRQLILSRYVLRSGRLYSKIDDERRGEDPELINITSFADLDLGELLADVPRGGPKGTSREFR